MTYSDQIIEDGKQYRFMNAGGQTTGKCIKNAAVKIHLPLGWMSPNFTQLILAEGC